ncbi:unnamed protein product [Haemonchus placei]|uniref:Uncharacterized protein n=1 Tax=Haemonchus placei TaxID=6290 RepID=A0A0N4W5G7_HAEPC|nr:unnamed protein product [Haemonchus placei]
MYFARMQWKFRELTVLRRLSSLHVLRLRSSAGVQPNLYRQFFHSAAHCPLRRLVGTVFPRLQLTNLLSSPSQLFLNSSTRVPSFRRRKKRVQVTSLCDREHQNAAFERSSKMEEENLPRSSHFSDHLSSTQR